MSYWDLRIYVHINISHRQQKALCDLCALGLGLGLCYITPKVLILKIDDIQVQSIVHVRYAN